MAIPRICSVEGCGKPHASKGYCRSHYDRMRRRGTLDYSGVTPAHEARRFLYEVALRHKSGCLYWPYARDGNGYAKINIEDMSALVHRVVCTITKGEPVPPKNKALHRCGNGDQGCVSPSCLYWGTDSDNQKDRVEHGTSNRGERQHSSKLTEEQVREIRLRKGTVSVKAMSVEYGVSKWTIFDILNRRNWAWLE